jgi:hypothetical protein
MILAIRGGVDGPATGEVVSAITEPRLGRSGDDPHWVADQALVTLEEPM